MTDKLIGGKVYKEVNQRVTQNIAERGFILMVDTQNLEKKIQESGLKTSYIIDKLGISRQALDFKKKNKRKFKVAEIYVLCDLLHIPNDERQAIFFADEVNI